MGKSESAVAFVAGIVGALVSFLTGMFGLAFTILMGMMLIDFVSGVMAALVSGEGLKSSRGYKGLFKKLYTLLLIGAVFMLEISVLHSNGVVTDGVSAAFIVIEFVSIVENGQKMNIPLGFLSKIITSAKSKVSLLNDENINSNK